MSRVEKGFGLEDTVVWQIHPQAIYPFRLGPETINSANDSDFSHKTWLCKVTGSSSSSARGGISVSASEAASAKFPFGTIRYNNQQLETNYFSVCTQSQISGYTLQ